MPLAALLTAPLAHAQLTWDANGTGTGQTNGGGAWLWANLWWNGSANQNWIAGSNGMAWVLGAENPSTSANEKLPKASRHGNYLRLTFRCLKSNKRGGAVLKLQSSSDLGAAEPWISHEAAVPDEDSTANGVIFDITDDGDYINVIADIPTTGTSHFARLQTNE